MTDGKPSFPWLGADDRSAVDEMIRNQSSEYWQECSLFVRRCVYAKAKNIPSDLHDEIIQEILFKIARYLPHFRFGCTLKTWVNQIIESCIIDASRKLQNKDPSHFPMIEMTHESDREGEGFSTSEEKSAEEVFLIKDELLNGWMALEEYVSTHSNPIRNRLIIKMVIIEGQTHAETAKAAGCSAPVVGYVVREAQRYAREKMGHKL